MGSIRIGTSGWMYKHWGNIFYPKNVKGKDQLHFYAEKFNTVEINSSFYRIPSENSVKDWAKSTPSDFEFAVKMNRFITHSKKLILDDRGRDRLQIFLRSLEPLKDKMPVMLVQLQPGFRANFERLDKFLRILKKETKSFDNLNVCCEFRHESWFRKQLYDILSKHNAGFVIATYPDKVEKDYPITSETVYIRYHATPQEPGYPKEVLDDWSTYIKNIKKNRRVKNIYIYFNNDFEGCAIEDAEYLKSKLSVS